MRSSLLTAAATLLCLTSLATSHAAIIPSLPKVFGAPTIIPDVFKQLGSVTNVLQPYTVTLHLAGKDEDGLETWLQQNAGQKVLTEAELANYISPSQTDLDTVTKYLNLRGVPTSSIQLNTYKNKVTFAAPIGQIASFFEAAFSNYQIDANVVQRTKQYTIPSELSSAVKLVSPLSSFIKPYKNSASPLDEVHAKERDAELERRGAPSAANCDPNSVTPTCLRQYYGTYDYKPTEHAEINDIFVIGFNNFSFSQSDLTSFLKKYRPDAADAQVSVINVAGSSNSQNPADDDAEVMLDTCTTVGATYPLKSVYYSYGTAETQGDSFQFAFQDVVDNYDKYGRPGVFSLSYVSLESYSTPEEANLMCKTVSHLAALGMTVVAGSGDWGVGGIGQYAGPDDPKCPPFQPLYPSGCPYVLSVGGTENFAPERVVDPALERYSPGAGFSNLFRRPLYQEGTIDTWRALPSARGADGYYNASGRAYPDISAQGSRYAIAYHGGFARVGGTSAATPTVASIIALLNDARRANGKPNVGWVNPLLYTNPIGTKDITIGNITGCLGAPQLGFQATQGWDPASGWGTPLFDNLRLVFGA